MKDPRRQACEELAELLAGEEGLSAARLAQLLGILAPPGPEPEPVSEPAGEGPRPIGVYAPRRTDGGLVFERPPPHPLGDHHAARRRIAARKAAGTTRVAWFGESAAAGYLYAPRVTPAGMLEAALAEADDRQAYEVVDLARTNETLASMVETVERALQLEPDLLVVFTGNNWELLETPEVSPYAPSIPARQRYGAALRRGLGGPLELARRLLEGRARRALARLAELAAGRPVVVVVPEVNLAAWEVRQPPPWLPGDATRRWHRLYRRALQALDRKRWSEADALGRELSDLDGGHCPTSWLVRGRALASRGDAAAARRAFERAVEAGSYATMACLGAPQASHGVQEILRAEADRHGFRTVDLPRIFREHTSSPLPGRRLFLDYCHLSAEGLAVLAAAVAGEILDGKSADRSALARSARARVPAEVEATALAGAAVHGAHRMLPLAGKHRQLAAWLERALAASPGIAAALRDLALARAAPGPEVLNAAQERNLASPYRLTLQHGWRWDDLDADLLEAILEVLDAEAGAEIRAALVRHHAVDGDSEGDGRELARSPYLWEPLARFYPEAMERFPGGHALLRCPWPETSFCLVATGDRGVDLELVARLPAVPGHDGPRQGKVEVELDGTPVAAPALTHAWTRHRVHLPNRHLHPALHRLTLRWPLPPAAGEAALAGAVHRLERGLEADLHPVFGEVFSLRARAASPAPDTGDHARI